MATGGWELPDGLSCTCTWHTDICAQVCIQCMPNVDHAHERTLSGSVSCLFKSQWPLYRSFDYQSGRKRGRKEGKSGSFLYLQTNISRRGDGYSLSWTWSRLASSRHQAGASERACASVPRRRSPRSDFCYTIMRCPWNCECASWPAGDWPHYPKETLTAVHSPPLLSEKVWWKKWERRTKSERRHDGDDVSECEREGGRETIAPRLVPIYRALKSLFWGKESKSLLKS